MNRLDSLRLAQFWHSRLELIGAGTSVMNPLLSAAVFEAVGWLVEGVFCGSFDPREADVVWTRFRRIVIQARENRSDFTSELNLRNFDHLLASDEPFRRSDQMIDGRQKEFEFGFFPYAQLLADRFAADKLALECLRSLLEIPDEIWLNWTKLWSRAADGNAVVSVLTDDAQQMTEPPDPTLTIGWPYALEQHIPTVVAGYLRILKHMEESRHFFEYAKVRSGRADFNSYCERYGALNGWRVPLQITRVRRRFEDLQNWLEFALLPSAREQLPNANWSAFPRHLSKQVNGLVSAWETYHLSAFLATK